MPLPVIDYTSPKRFAEYSSSGGGGYAAPSNVMARLMSAVTSQGSIAQIAAPYPNSSYSVEFYGPSLSCGYIPRDSVLYDRIHVAEFSTGEAVAYLGFVPQRALRTATKDEEAIYGLNVTLGASTSAGPLPTFDKSYSSTDHARFYAIMPFSGNYADSIIECGLYNSSYVVDFSFENGQQDITIRNETRLNGVPWSDGGPTTGFSVQQVAYTAVIDALGGLLVGTLRSSHYGFVTATHTRITSTILMQTQEMNRTLVVTKSIFGDQPEERTLKNMTMSKALEQVVTNTTLSFFSNSYFL